MSPSKVSLHSQTPVCDRNDEEDSYLDNHEDGEDQNDGVGIDHNDVNIDRDT